MRVRVERSLLVRGGKGYDLQGCIAGMPARCGVLAEKVTSFPVTLVCVRDRPQIYSQEFAIANVTSRKHKGEIQLLHYGSPHSYYVHCPLPLFRGSFLEMFSSLTSFRNTVLVLRVNEALCARS